MEAPIAGAGKAREINLDLERYRQSADMLAALGVKHRFALFFAVDYVLWRVSTAREARASMSGDGRSWRPDPIPPCLGKIHTNSGQIYHVIREETPPLLNVQDQ
jgi:hypothetical protein